MPKQPEGDKVDWRGTPIEIGSLVIYGSSVGQSIQLNEATVVGFTPSGRVNVEIIRRSYRTSSKDIVHVGNDRLTVVEKLPETNRKTQAEKKAEVKAQKEARRKNYESHDLQIDQDLLRQAEERELKRREEYPYAFARPIGPLVPEFYMNEFRRCTRCGADQRTIYGKECE